MIPSSWGEVQNVKDCVTAFRVTVTGVRREGEYATGM
jgi:hypothetical protein